jgi:hypothetical protein
MKFCKFLVPAYKNVIFEPALPNILIFQTPDSKKMAFLKKIPPYQKMVFRELHIKMAFLNPYTKKLHF